MKLIDGYDRRKNPAKLDFRPMTVTEAKCLCAGDRVWFKALDGTARQLKVNGQPKVWKTDPKRVEVPAKYGMYEYTRFSNHGGVMATDDRKKIILLVKKGE